MRLKPSFSTISLLVLATAAPSLVAAQDEFDDFDDVPSTPAPTQQAPRPSGDELDELDDGAPATEGDVEADDLDDRPSRPEASPAVDRDAADAYRERRHLLHNTWSGAVGGLRVVDAGSGAPAAFRAQLGLNFFFADGWLTLPDSIGMGRESSNSHVGGALSVSWNPWEFLEFYASLSSWANSNPQDSPELFQVLGDTLFGVKAGHRLLPWLYVGGDLSIGFLNTVGDIGLVGDSTSFGLRANATADLRELDSPIPLIARLNLQYWFDNSAALISGVEQARYQALLDPRPCPELMGGTGNCLEDRHLTTRVERYALQIDRVDRFTIGIGLEAPIKVMEDFHISPIAEWLLHVPVNRQGFSCLFVPGAGTPDEPGVGQDGCLDRQGVSAFEQTLTLGVRVLPPLRGLSVFAALDVGLTGVNTFVRELSGQAPYNVMFGLGYAFDTLPRVVETEREVVREVVRETPPPVRGRLVGTVVEQASGAPIAGAVVSFPGRELTDLSTNASGGFRSYELDPGEVQIGVAHPEYEPGQCAGTVAAEGGDVEVRCELVSLPRVGSLRGRVTGEGSGPVAGASVSLTGPVSRSFTTGADGSFSAADLPPGSYTARVEATDHLLRQDGFEVRPREQTTPEIVLIPRPRTSLVALSGRQITIRRQVNFATDSAEILPTSNQLLSEVADIILRHPELTRIEIQGHTDNRGGAPYNQDLSQRRADAVRTWLIRAGVAEGRLQARGYGQDQPLVPNITAANRARNRRVQFMIVERSQQ